MGLAYVFIYVFATLPYSAFLLSVNVNSADLDVDGMHKEPHEDTPRLECGWKDT